MHINSTMFQSIASMALPVFPDAPSFNTYIEMCYRQLGCPPVGCSSAWGVYCDLLALMWQCEGIAALLTAIDDQNIVNDEELQLLPGLQDLHETDGYMGSLANGLGLGKCTMAINKVDSNYLALIRSGISSEDEDEDEHEEDKDEADEEDIENYL